MEELQKSRAAWNECKGGNGEEGLKGRWGVGGGGGDRENGWYQR